MFALRLPHISNLMLSVISRRLIDFLSSIISYLNIPNSDHPTRVEGRIEPGQLPGNVELFDKSP
jgi:hypothetical protein